MSKYLLVTFYQHTREGGQPEWLVYGHIAPGINEKRGEFTEKDEALEECFRHGVPVMLGRSYESVLEKLHQPIR
jgi:hypothetical protein